MVLVRRVGTSWMRVTLAVNGRVRAPENLKRARKADTPWAISMVA